MADTFHINIEEPIIGESLRNSRGKILHIHIADSNKMVSWISNKRERFK